MPPIPPPDREGFTTTTPVPLYWCSYGSSPARLLVLHGGPGASHEYLLPQMLELAHGDSARELVLYDQRGGGRSRHDDDRAEITWRSQVEDLGRVIGELSLHDPVIVGYSWGGLLALLQACEAAAGAETPPSKLVLIDPAPVTRALRVRFEEEFSRRQAGTEVQALRAELAASGLRERDADAYRHRAFELSVAGYFADPSRAHDLTPFRVTGRVQQSIWASLGDYDLVPALEAVRDRLGIPSLVVHGREDPIPLESSERCARALGGELVVIDDCGHVPYVEKPAELFSAIGRFLGASDGEQRVEDGGRRAG
jgi:proline iminopeptidase